MQLVGQKSGLDRTAFEAAGGLLSQVLGKVGHVCEVEVGTADRAVRVSGNDFLCGAKELEGYFYFFWGFIQKGIIELIHVLYPPSIESRLLRGPLWLWP